ncbi:MAG: membrane protein insertase YidC, partial [Azorhizobium sp. 39-67-5]
MTDQKNMFIAIGLSLAILIGWQYFYGIPMAEKQRQAAEQQRIIQQAEQAQQQAPAQPQPGDAAGAAIPGTPAGATAAGRAMTREAALAATPRIAIDTPRLKGSIALKGGRVDDLSLLDYHETVDPQSPHIVLLAPAGSPHPFYAEFGWTTAPGATMKVPGPDTVWTASTGALTPKAPLVLTYDNGEGLLFKRTYTVDENYMFAVKDEVENKGSAPVTLYPYA